MMKLSVPVIAVDLSEEMTKGRGNIRNTRSYQANKKNPIRYCNSYVITFDSRSFAMNRAGNDWCHYYSRRRAKMSGKLYMRIFQFLNKFVNCNRQKLPTTISNDSCIIIRLHLEIEHHESTWSNVSQNYKWCFIRIWWATDCRQLIRIISKKRAYDLTIRLCC